MIRIAGLSQALSRLERLDLHAAQARGLRAAAALLAQAVRQSLSFPPGENPALPALRSGALRASIVATEVRAPIVATDVRAPIVATDAGVQATSPVAVYQEFGTARMPPRPFLGPAAIRHADDAARLVADAIHTEATA